MEDGIGASEHEPLDRLADLLLECKDLADLGQDPLLQRLIEQALYRTGLLIGRYLTAASDREQKH
jgi:hypothetical protein